VDLISRRALASGFCGDYGTRNRGLAPAGFFVDMTLRLAFTVGHEWNLSFTLPTVLVFYTTSDFRIGMVDLIPGMAAWTIRFSSLSVARMSGPLVGRIRYVSGTVMVLWAVCLC
jgi:hypothetical protein